MTDCYGSSAEVHLAKSLLGDEEMKRLRSGAKPDQQQAEREIQAFLEALNSYPQSFAQDPCLSFEQHFVALASEQSESAPVLMNS